MPWTAAIVAGGAASRLNGRDKSQLRVGGRSILERQLAALDSLADRIVIVANDAARFRAAGVPVVEDLVPGTAALGGIYTALATATTDRVLVIACDMPFLTGRFLRHVVACADEVDLAIPRSADGYQPLCACYARSCLEPVRRRVETGALRVQDLVSEVRTREIAPDELAPFDPNGVLLFNVNTPDDYERARHFDPITQP